MGGPLLLLDERNWGESEFRGRADGARDHGKTGRAGGDIRET